MDALLQASLLIGLAILFLVLGLALAMTRRDEVSEALARQGALPRTIEEIEMSRPFSDRILGPMLEALAGALARLTPQQSLQSLSHWLEIAGNPFGWRVINFLGFQALCTLVSTATGILFLLRARTSPLVGLLLFVTLVVLGYYLPIFWLKSKASARQADILASLPDALDLLTISVEAGLGLDAAIQRVTQKWDNELSRGFGRVLAEIRVGKLRRDALRDMASRAEVTDLNNFIAAVIQAEELGTSIITVMRVQSEQMRIMRRQRAQEKAQQAPIKMLFPLLLCIFPALFIVILGPAAIRFMNSSLFGK